MAETARATRAGRAIAGALSASLLALIVLPVVALFAYAGTAGLLATVRDAGFWTSLEFTLLSSGLAVGLGLLTGVPLGYVLARYRFVGREVVESLVLIPVMIPHLVVGIGLLLLFAPTNPVGHAVAAAGIPIFDAIWGVVLVMVYVGASYVVLSSQLAFKLVEPGTIEVARSLGASPTEAFVTVTLPGAARGIATGALLMWARGVSEVGGFLILAFAVTPSPPWSGPVTSTSSIYIYDLYQSGSVPGTAGAAAILVLVAAAVFVIVRLLDRTGFAWARGRWWS